MLTTILMDLLNRTGGRIGRTTSGRIVMLGIKEPVASEVRRHAADGTLALHLGSPTTGNITGTRWRLCPECWREAFTTSARACFLTPGCTGTLTIPERIGSPPEHKGTTCERPGCERPGWRGTHWGGVYCLTDWHALALHDLVGEG